MKRILLGLSMVLGLVAVPAAGTVYAMDLFPTCNSADCKVVDTGAVSLANRVRSIINIAIYIIAAVAVIMIIVGGLRMVMANGDAGAVKAGRDTILWSVIGLVVAIMASAIVNFVINWGWIK